jgi:Ca-activated chloride channel family protein
MFRFEQPNYLYLTALWLIVAVALYFALYKQRQRYMEQVGKASLLEQLLPNFSLQHYRLKYALWAAVIAFIGLALANPQIGSETEKVKRKGIDIIIALDVSQSMLAEDISPNRLERAKQTIAKLIERTKNDRLGLVVFAGSAYMQMPLSSDYSAAKMMLQTINTDIMPTQGTAIGEALDVALAAFDDKEDNAQAGNRKNKAIVVISDGEDHEEGALIIAEKAAEQAVAVYTIGIGSEAGGTIPVIANGRRVDNKRDDSGNEVVSKLNESALRSIAQSANGQYYRIDGNSESLTQLLNDLNTLEKREFDDRVFTDYADQFQYFIAIALLLLIAELMLPNKPKLPQHKQA